MEPRSGGGDRADGGDAGDRAAAAATAAEAMRQRVLLVEEEKELLAEVLEEKDKRIQELLAELGKNAKSVSGGRGSDAATPRSARKDMDSGTVSARRGPSSTPRSSHGKVTPRSTEGTPAPTVAATLLSMGKNTMKMEDVCLSARSFSENHLIFLRDEEISVKERQIELLNQQSSRLTDNLEQLEAEIARMRTDTISKDKIVNELRLKCQKQTDFIAELQRDVQVKKGREAAMEVATNQNNQLLILLQQTENLAQELEKKNTLLEDELQDLRAKQKKMISKNAELETTAEMDKHQIATLRKELMTVKSAWEVEEKSLRHRLERLEKESHETIEELRAEVATKREAHYEMLAKVQEAESQLRRNEDEVMESRTEMEEMQLQKKDLLAQVAEVRRWADSQQARYNAALAALQSDLNDATGKVRSLEEQRTALTAQLHEMSSTVLKAVDKQQDAIDECMEAKSELNMRATQLESLKKRMIKENTLQGKRRMKVELEQRTLAEQLELMREENVRLAHASNANFEEQVKQCEELAMQCKVLQEQLARSRAVQQGRLERILSTAGFQMRSAGNFFLDLSSCSLAVAPSEEKVTENINRLAKQLSHLLVHHDASEHTLHINLANNALNDSHVASALSKVVQVAVTGARQVFVNLNENCISAEGIHALVIALGKNPLVQHVYVHRDGVIEGLRGADTVYTVTVQGNKASQGTYPEEGDDSHPENNQRPPFFPNLK